MKRRPIAIALALASLAARSAIAAPQSFVNFESGHVRPVAIAGDLLFAVDTPDNRLAVYVLDGLPSTAPIRLKLAAEIAVGLEPVAVAASRVNCLGSGICTFDVWVVNHLSDDVTAMQLTFDTGKKTVHLLSLDTLPTCDEPRDIVLAGKYTATQAPARAFVTTARRGQNCPLGAKLGDAGTPRGLVQVFNAKTHALDGTVELFSDTPRGLAVSRDGQRVYAAGFLSGNRTATVPESAVSANGGLPPPPPMSTAGPPSTGLIVQYNPADSRWEENGLRPPATTPKDWSAFIAFSLPDYDVFAIDANAATPSGVREIPGVGTVLFNLAVRPAPKAVTGFPGLQHRDEIFVSNTEALNPVRFETVLRDHFVDNRITVIRDWKNPHVYVPPPAGGPFGGWQFDVSPVPLNAITYSCLPPGCATSTADLDDVLALPTDMVFTTDGKKLFVAALGSGAVGIFDADQLSQGHPTPRQVLHVGGGPSGLALDPVHDRLYVMDRFSNSIVVVKQASTAPAVVGSVALYDPSPAMVTKGRHILYDARNTSGHGDVACASCHAFGDFDGLAWDLGNPTQPTAVDCNPFVISIFATFHPMKGPMTTQSLRGLAGAGPMHWRGDRTACDLEPTALPDKGAYDVPLGFKKFNGAFVSLLGRANQLDTTPGGELDQLTDFVLSIRYPPNPIRPFDGFSSNAQLGQTFFLQQSVDASLKCNDCHAVPLGTNGMSSFDLEPQNFKIPHARNLYQKVGMFGIASGQSLGFPPTGPTGDQVRGFGYLHDGSVDTLLTFLHANAFSFPTDADRQHVEQFLLEFDTGLAPIVGQQVTVTKTNGKDPSALITRADAGDCDLVARGVPDPKSPREHGYWYHQGAGDPAPLFYGDTASSKVTPAVLLTQITPGGYLTYTCVPPGSGRRIGIDRDCDGVLDGDQTTAPNPITAYPTGLCP